MSRRDTVILGGYFPKLVVPRPEWIPDPRAWEICSVSNCVSKGPEGWIDRWRHNWLGWFNTVADAQSVVPPNQIGQYRLFAYRLAPAFYRKGQRESITIPEDVRPEPLPSKFVPIGFDAYSRSMDSILGPECSPLSCNGMAHEFRTNRHCLLDTLDDAHAAALRFSIEQPEPGDYYVAEVLEHPRPAAEQGVAADEAREG